MATRKRVAIYNLSGNTGYKPMGAILEESAENRRGRGRLFRADEAGSGS